ncbi:hypothetical protein TanjilG_20571 [Lupinus angustifolius]|uniref:Exostosin GT47 domain-containing protein n=1 Tax=Lupinus angustifolius TaxID=3871 RepID=A0A1J7HS51_LUPAN|nr:PREDICTED: probable arabinosyltransferase ARAD1 [Lupinus angustifolius]OIW03267.1 hypothetical protein TanjilG_20571 [Lupinus angustifolius]
MAETRNVSAAINVASKHSLLCFSMTTVMFMTIMCMLFVLRSPFSESSPKSIYQNLLNNLLPNSNYFTTFNDTNSEVQNHNVESSFGSENVEANRETKEISKTDDSVKCRRHEKVVLKVFMYDLPSEFHFGLMDWKPEGKSVWPNMKTKIPYYPGFLFLQHSIEYWLTLDLLNSELPEAASNVKAAIRVINSSEADIIFVPFFSSLSYNLDSKTSPRDKSSRNNVLQDKLVKFLRARDEWKKSGGRDHLILAHHPNSILNARKVLWPATFILSDFGRYPSNMANVEKDVITPYKHLVDSYVNDSSSFHSRPTLLYFQGGIKRKDGGHIRQELYSLLKDEKGVHFSFGSAKEGGVKTATEGMRSSKFCLNIAGDTPSSNRLFDAIVSHCVPVIISDEIELPYEDVLDYTEFCIFVRSTDALKEKFLINLISSIGKDEWTRMWNKLKEVENFFEFQFPSKEGDAVQMIWQAVARKIPRIRLKTNRSRRFFRSLYGKEMRLKSKTAPGKS